MAAPTPAPATLLAARLSPSSVKDFALMEWVLKPKGPSAYAIARLQSRLRSCAYRIG
jgi:hypothetical protein